MGDLLSGSGRFGGRERLAGILALVAAALAAGWLALRPRPAPPAPPPSPVGVFEPTAEQWSGLGLYRVEAAPFAPLLHTDGRIAAVDPLTTAVYSPVSGRVLRLYAQAGQAVRRGAPLAAIAGVESEQAAGDLAAAEAQVRAARANEQRLQTLYKDQGASLKDWQQSQADLAAAENSLRSARARLAALGLPTEGVRADGRQAYLLRAPVSGVITQQSLSLGQTVASLAAGGGAPTPAFVVSDLSRVWLVGAMREADAARARLGQAVEARPLGSPGEILRGRLDFISPVVDTATRRVMVRATIPNPGGRLRPDAFVDFAVAVDPGRPALALPADAVIYDGPAAHVWVADVAHRRLTVRAIAPGRSLDGKVEVLSGLRPGESVVTHGALFIDQAAKAD